MSESLHLTVERIAIGIELVGVALIVVGGVIATVVFVSMLLRTSFDDAFHGYRANLGRAILLGLEFLVAGDIIETILIAPTLESAGGLALIVAIRTFLSFSLETEISGRLPWKQNPPSG